MFNTILVPIDLAHADKLEKAIGIANDLARNSGANLVYAGVTTSAPTSVAHNPAEFAESLDKFAKAAAEGAGVPIDSIAITSPDPAADLDQKLMEAIDKTGADAVVMASHVPGLVDHVFTSNAGWLATHAPVSVFVVR